MDSRVEVRFRGIDPTDGLVEEARRWISAIEEALGEPMSVEVFINRSAPCWGGTTSVSVDLQADSREILEVQTRQDPHDALREAFQAAARRLANVRKLDHGRGRA